jgi:hypothetical protein
MWNEFTITGGEKKEVVVDKLNLPEARFYCYACESTITSGGKEDCSICPINWGDGNKGYHSCTENEQSPYNVWVNTTCTATRKKYAKIIANMKWRTKK